MKKPQKIIAGRITKATTFIHRELSFRGACAASVIVHLSLLVVLSVILNFLGTSDAYSPPLVFDYVFAPAQSLDTSDLTDLDLNKETKAPIEQQKTDLPKEAQRVQSPSRFVEPDSPRRYKTNPQVSQSETWLASHESEGSTEALDAQNIEESSDPKFVPDQPEPDVTDREYALTAIQLTSIDFSRTRTAKSNIVPAKVSMTNRQHKMLRKKFKKWTENLYRMDLPDSSIVWEHKGQKYSAKVRTVSPRTETDIEQVIIEVSTEENGYTMSCEMRMKRLAFSNFAQFVDYWDPRVAVHDDVLNGRFHTNTTFNVSQTYGVKPEFRGKVTTASYEVKSAGAFPFMDKKSIFIGGIETGVKEIRLPKNNLPFVQDTTILASQTKIFNEEAWVTFSRDGSFSWKVASRPDSIGYHPLQQDQSFYIVGSKKKKLHLKGVIDGQVLVYSPGKIVIDGSLTYARHPELTFDADDYLGIVSEKDIEIAHPRVTGPGNLYIYASLYAKGRFKVRHLRGKKGEATLYIYGGLTAGSISATEPRYATHIQFDKRLEAKRPPNFPMTDRYEVTEWDGIWEVRGQRSLNR